MKRRELIQHLNAHGCILVREGGSHSVYGNPVSGHHEAVPRHAEIKKHLSRAICRRLGVPEPNGS